MRKVVALALVLVTAFFSVPQTAFAQAMATSKAATISGEAVDAGGRAIVNQRVELVRDSVVVQATVTGSRGEWLFVNVAPGTYVVRMMVNGQPAGVRVSVVAGQPVTSAVIVAPSAAVAKPAFLLALGLLGGIAAGAAIAAVVITTVVVATKGDES